MGGWTPPSPTLIHYHLSGGGQPKNGEEEEEERDGQMDVGDVEGKEGGGVKDAEKTPSDAKL